MECCAVLLLVKIGYMYISAFVTSKLISPWDISKILVSTPNYLVSTLKLLQSVDTIFIFM